MVARPHRSRAPLLVLVAVATLSILAALALKLLGAARPARALSSAGRVALAPEPPADVPLREVSAPQTERLPAVPAVPDGDGGALPRTTTEPPTLLVRVCSAQDEPVPGASVEAFLGLSLGRAQSPGRPIAHATSDLAGRCELALQPVADLHVFELAQHALTVQVSAPGRCPGEWRVLPTQVLGPHNDLRAVLEPGAGLQGRVVDGDGHPVAGASVQVRVKETGGDRVTLQVNGVPAFWQTYLSQTSTASDGTFTAAVTDPSRAVLVTAAEESCGEAQVEVTVEPGAPVWLGDVVLQPVGVLEGCVRYPDGSPAAATLVRATCIRADEEHDPRAAPLAPGTPASVRTDAGGCFRFARLAPGSYHLEVAASTPAARSTDPRAFRTPVRGIVLRAQDVALRVRVVDAAGRAIRGAPVDVARVRAEPADPSGTPRLGERVSARTRGDPPAAVIALPPGERVLVTATLKACHPVQALVTIADTPGEQALVLEVFPRGEAARVVVSVLDAEGVTPIDWRVDVFDPFTRLLVRADLAPDGDGALPALAPGPWLLQARPERVPARTSGALPEGLGKLVDLRPGAPRRIELRLE